jgi:antitoxin VapB
MPLNIKDQEAHRLAQELAKETGESMTQAVVEALKERLQRVRRGRRANALAADLCRIGDRYVSDLKGRPVDHAELLYDSRGLPK